MTGGVIINAETSKLGLKRYSFVWVADANGDAKAWLDGRRNPLLEGIPVRVVTRPSASQAPAIDYDIYLNDSRGRDLFNGKLGNRSGATIQVKALGNVLADEYRFAEEGTVGKLQFIIDNAGSGGAGVTVIYVRPFLPPAHLPILPSQC